jgi:hypothetical protein
MNTYKVLLNGKNFLMNIEGKISRKGFYASRIIQASNEEEAQKLAIEMIVADQKLNNVVINTSSDSPNIFVDEVTIMKNHVSMQEKEKANKVYMFYSED